MNYYRRLAMRDLPLPPTKTVLLLEDHPCLCEVLATVLRRCGYWVIAATTGAEAAQFSREVSGIDLLLGPIEMPEMGREALAAWFSSAQPRAKVMWTSTGHHETGTAEAIVEKPYIYIDAFIRKVRAVLNPKPAVQTTALAA